MTKTSPPGIRARHGRACASGDGRRCNCQPTFEAAVWSERDNKKLRRSFRTLSEAKGWRADAISALRKGTLAAATRLTVRGAAEAWIAEVEAGRALTRSQVAYKPSVRRAYTADLRRFVIPELGDYRLAQLRRRDVQRFIDALVASGLSGSRVRGILMPLRVVVRRALENDELTMSPLQNLRLPPDSARRERVASPDEAARLLAALPEADRALWGTAFYAGLRRGELRGLRWEDVDDGATVIHVRRSWDEKEGEIQPKSAKGHRKVPVAQSLRLLLLEHKARTGRRSRDLVFGRTASHPFTPTHIRDRALAAWVPQVWSRSACTSAATPTSR